MNSALQADSSVLKQMEQLWNAKSIYKDFRSPDIYSTNYFIILHSWRLYFPQQYQQLVEIHIVICG